MKRKALWCPYVYLFSSLISQKKSDMSHEKAVKEKSNKKAPMKSLKEKRAAKAAKRNEKEGGGKLTISNPFAKK